MNLHAIASQVISVVNPSVQVTWLANQGNVSNADYSRTPQYTSQTIPAQVQHLQFDDLKQIEGLGIQGLRRKLYLFGNVNGMVRTLSKGGDLVVLPDGSTWLVAFVLETYGHGLTGQRGWCAVVITLQNTPTVATAVRFVLALSPVHPVAAGTLLGRIAISPSSWAGSLELSGSSSLALSGATVVAASQLSAGSYPATISATPGPGGAALLVPITIVVT